jgi:hypothetical protein
MAAPEYNVFVGDDDTIGPSRPDADDFGGTAKENDPEYPPDPTTQPDARDHNQIAWGLAGCCAVAPAAIVELRLTIGGVFYVHNVWSVNPNVTPATFTVTHSDIGSVSLSWDAGTFPLGPRPFGFTCNSDAALCIGRAWHSAPSAIGVRIVRFSTGIGYDSPFTLCIGGETD